MKPVWHRLGDGQSILEQRFCEDIKLLIDSFALVPCFLPSSSQFIHTDTLIYLLINFKCTHTSINSDMCECMHAFTYTCVHVSIHPLSVWFPSPDRQHGKWKWKWKWTWRIFKFFFCFVLFGFLFSCIQNIWE